jgi:hypothetical protein
MPMLPICYGYLAHTTGRALFTSKDRYDNFSESEEEIKQKYHLQAGKGNLL